MLLVIRGKMSRDKYVRQAKLPRAAYAGNTLGIEYFAKRAKNRSKKLIKLEVKK